MSERTFLPHERPGKVSLWLSALGFASWVILPIITGMFRTTAPITDTWVMPAIGVVLMLVAAVSNVVTYVFLRQRSVLNLAVFSLTTVFAIFTAVMLIGEGLAGV